LKEILHGGFHAGGIIHGKIFSGKNTPLGRGREISRRNFLCGMIKK